MKRLTPHADSPLRTRRPFPMLALLVLLPFVSCIYDAPGDRFYRTLWQSEEQPFRSSASVEADALKDLTLEFLCGNSVCVKATGAAGSYGTYDSHDLTAYFHKLRLSFVSGDSPATIVLEEAHRTDDLLLVSWHYSGSAVSYTTRLVRRSSY